VWTRACGLFPSANAFGDRAHRLPRRLADARRSGLTGATAAGDTQQIHEVPLDQLGFASKDVPRPDRRRPAYIWHFPGVDTLFGVPGFDAVVGTPDDPAFYTFARFVRPGDEYRFQLRETQGVDDGRGKQSMGPIRPRDTVYPLAALADRANPFNPLDFNPVQGSMGGFGSTALPYRPPPRIAAARRPPPGFDASEPRGLFIPNETVARLQREGFDDFDQNYSQSELSWNRGASQEDEKELKELYADLELLDSRLWFRIGKQNIVWGKTELFRTTDQFNPQDLALASLPSLEESRIALWSARTVYSLYEVGPLDDTRLELAVNFDEMEPTDLGRCGEPYTPNPVCDKTSGLFAHGLAGFGLAGEIRPEDPWNSWNGIEVGARVEFRWNRFSFAISDFWGYDDFPFLDQAFIYERNVDPRTGRPRRAGSRAGCDPDGLVDGDASGCLSGGDDALFHHHANQQRFAVICSASVGFNDLDRTVCAQSVLNSQLLAAPGLTVAGLLSGLVAGNPRAHLAAQGQLTGGVPIPRTVLNVDPCDNFLADCVTSDPNPFNTTLAGIAPPFRHTLNNALTVQQEAMLGCGPFYQTNCDFDGIDLLNAELSALLPSWPGFPGTYDRKLRGTRGNQNPAPGDGWRTDDVSRLQPGTMRRDGAASFLGGAVCTRYEERRLQVIPGCRGPLDPGWDPNVDGNPFATPAPGFQPNADLAHFFTGAGADGVAGTGDDQIFMNELGAASFNLLMALVALSGPGDAIDELDVTQTNRLGACSFVQPQFCSNVQAFYAVSHTTCRSVRAGGNRRFGRTDFDWHQGGAGVLRYEKRNVLGFSLDFAEDVSKSNWGVESTWIEDIPYTDNDTRGGIRRVDTYNVTVSVDRPTFVNFLNSNRTLFINSQWFFQYIDGYRRGFTENGPFNVLATFTVDTGYFQDRLLPTATFVWDFGSGSGALLPQIVYRFTENFSATFGVAGFWGHSQRKTPALTTVGDFPYRVGRHSDVDYVDNILTPVRDRDEVFLTIRYTF
jgi:hypothetical protein